MSACQNFAQQIHQLRKARQRSLMIDRLLNSFKFRKRPEMTDAKARPVSAPLEPDVASIARQSERPKRERPYVVLTPIVPKPVRAASGWFGGHPCLPSRTPWPEVDGEKGLFLCQIDLAFLPQNIWHGLGPRSGHLAFFLHPTMVNPAVLHVDGALEKRIGPPQCGADWFWPRDINRKLISPNKTNICWPINIASRVGPLPETMYMKKGQSPSLPDASKNEAFDIRQPEFQPFHSASLKLLVDQTNKRIAWSLKEAEKLVGQERLTSETRSRAEAYLFDLQQKTADIDVFLKTHINPLISQFNARAFRQLTEALSDMWIPTSRYRGTDKDGTPLAEFDRLSLFKSESGSLVHLNYLDHLKQYALALYDPNPTALSPAHRSRFEGIWAFEAKYETGAMGHAPLGQFGVPYGSGVIEIPYGPGTEYEVLLELPSSDLVGWTWGGEYHIVFLIKHDDLARGDFSKVISRVTN